MMLSLYSVSICVSIALRACDVAGPAGGHQALLILSSLTLTPCLEFCSRDLLVLPTGRQERDSPLTGSGRAFGVGSTEIGGTQPKKMAVETWKESEPRKR